MKHHLLTEEEINILVNRITNARYDSVERFFTSLSDKFHKDAMKDDFKDRLQLSWMLFTISASCEDIAIELNKAWKICKDKMEK